MPTSRVLALALVAQLLGPGSAQAGKAKSKEIDVSLAEGKGTSFQVSDVERIEVADQDIAQAVKVGTNVVDIAGAKPGTTRVVVTSRQGARVVFRVRVGKDAPPAAKPAKKLTRAQQEAQARALTLHQKAEGLLKAGKAPEAAALLREGLARDPNDAEGHRLLGSCLAEQGKMEEAAEQFRAYLKGAPEDDPHRHSVQLLLKQYQATK